MSSVWGLGLHGAVRNGGAGLGAREEMRGEGEKPYSTPDIMLR